MHSVAADNCFTLHVEMRYGIYPCLIASYAIQIHSELNMSVKCFFFFYTMRFISNSVSLLVMISKEEEEKKNTYSFHRVASRHEFSRYKDHLFKDLKWIDFDNFDIDIMVHFSVEIQVLYRGPIWERSFLPS